MQFRAAPKTDCSEAALSLVTLLQSRRDYGSDSHALLLDLVKSHDSDKHEVISTVLKIYERNIGK